MVGYLNKLYLQGGETGTQIKPVIGREVAVTYFCQKSKCGQYFVDGKVAMFLSVFTQNYEMAFVSIYQGFRLTLFDVGIL